jgi:hypothetical protein
MACRVVARATHPLEKRAHDDEDVGGVQSRRRDDGKDGRGGRVWDAETGCSVAALQGQESWTMNRASFSPTER